MTNRECKINAMIALWGDLLREKEEKVHELWAIENKLSKLKEELNKYGISEKISGMGKNPEAVDPMDDLDRSFTYDGSSNVQQL